MLRVRRDNLANTIASLEGRLASHLPQSESAHSNPATRFRAERL
jgi:hypothetical protein